MFLTINIGNANILAAAYEGREKLFCSQLRTDPLKTADEYAIGLKNLLQLYGFSPEQLEGAILSCVAPALAGTLRPGCAPASRGAGAHGGARPQDRP